MIALANTVQNDDRFLLVGIEDKTKKIIGVNSHPDQSVPQQYLDSKTNRPIKFSYHTVELDGHQLGVYCVKREQEQPIFAKEKIGDWQANVVWYRSGSSTKVKTPDELLNEERGRKLKPSIRGPGVWSGEYGLQTKAMVDRWLSVLEAHNVHPHWIAKVFPGFEIAEDCLGDWRDIARFLSMELREATCNLFNVRREWLEEGGGAIMEISLIDKGFDRFIDELVDAKKRDCYRRPELVAFKSCKRDLDKDWWGSRAALLLITKLDLIGETYIFQYRPYWSIENWGNGTQRIIAKMALMIGDQLDCDLGGSTLPGKRLHELREGLAFPKDLLNMRKGGRWDPLHYVYESPRFKTKQLDELHHVKEVAKAWGILAKVDKARQELKLTE